MLPLEEMQQSAAETIQRRMQLFCEIMGIMWAINLSEINEKTDCSHTKKV